MPLYSKSSFLLAITFSVSFNSFCSSLYKFLTLMISSDSCMSSKSPNLPCVNNSTAFSHMSLTSIASSLSSSDLCPSDSYSAFVREIEYQIIVRAKYLPFQDQPLQGSYLPGDFSVYFLLSPIFLQIYLWTKVRILYKEILYVENGNMVLARSLTVDTFCLF